MIAGYAFDRSLADTKYAARLIGQAAHAGVDTLITKAGAITSTLSKLCRDAGLTVLGSVACFSDHADPPLRTDLRPVDENGGWTPMEWYTGLIPTSVSYLDDLARKVATFAGNPDIDGLVFDFLRWPLHWELELRPGATPRHSSFDPVTLAAFADNTGITTTLTPDLLLNTLRKQWFDWRESVVTAIAARLAAAARATRPKIALSLFLVPGDAAQRRLVGQDVAALSSHVDSFFVMTYHGILRQPPQWIAYTVADVRGKTDKPVAAMVQTTADSALARGADWGHPLDDAAFAAALAEVDGPLCLFPAEGMDDLRWHTLAAAVSQRSSQ